MRRGFLAARRTRWGRSLAPIHACRASRRDRTPTKGPPAGCCTTGTGSPSTRAVSTIRRSPMARSGPSGSSSGPARASRAMAIVHIAVFDAVNAIAGRYRLCRAVRCRARRLDGGRDRAGGARYSERALPLAESRIRRRAGAGPRHRQWQTAEGARHRGRTACGGGDPAPSRRRRVGTRRAAGRHRVHHEHRPRSLAPGSGEPGTACARCLLERGDALRAALERPVSRAAAARARLGANTRRHSPRRKRSVATA